MVQYPCGSTIVQPVAERTSQMSRLVRLYDGMQANFNGAKTWLYSLTMSCTLCRFYVLLDVCDACAFSNSFFKFVFQRRRQ